MAHYAFLNNQNIVTEVIVGVEETELIEGLEPEIWYQNFRGQVCKRTSYNGNIRKNYAGVGYSYDETLDSFIAPQPYPSWKLDKRNSQWKAPIAHPTDGLYYFWNEENLNWELSDFSGSEE